MTASPKRSAQRTWARARLVCFAGLLMFVGGTGTAGAPLTGSLAEAVERAPAGAVLRVPPGEHRGSIRITRPLTLRFARGAVVVAPDDAIGIEVVDTDGVRVDGAVVRGGAHGVVIRHSTDVRFDDLTSTGARLHGLFAQNSEVVVSGCRVAAMASPIGQGVEIINSDLRPPSTVRGCEVSGPVYEGLVSHVSEVTFADNVVVGATERGVSITEMSVGRAVRNEVRGSRGTAYWCGDMSHCAFVDNVATGIEASTPGFRSAEGHGLVVQFHSHAEISGLSATDFAGKAVLEMSGSITTSGPDRTPAAWPLLLFGGALIGIPAALSRLTGISGWRLLLTTAFGVQLVHQGEHLVQVLQAKVFHSGHAHGVAGSLFDNEWVHLEFNTVLLLAIIATAIVAGANRRVMLIAASVQTYHEVEHVTKVVQYVRDGLNPAPGIVGASADLVWFHFSINLAVLVLLATALATTRPRKLEAIGTEIRYLLPQVGAGGRPV